MARLQHALSKYASMLFMTNIHGNARHYNTQQWRIMDVMAERDTAGSRTVTRGDTVTSPVRRIKDLPPAILNELNDKLIGGMSCRDASQWVTRQGHKFSFKSLNIYRQRVIRPAVKLGAQIQQVQALTESRELSRVDHAMAVKEVTQQVLTAGPLVARVEKLLQHADGDLDASVGSGDLKGRSSMIQAARASIETQAKLLGVGAFGANQAAGSGTTIQIAIATHRNDGDPSIDICEMKR
jgi:hypothetical protein